MANKEIVMVPTNELEVDRRYQRNVDTLLVSKIARHYSEALFSPLLVAERHTPNGTFKYVVDGQHRLEAARLLGIKEVPCFIYQGMDPSQEATLFVNQQVATARLTPRDTYKANVFIGNPENIDVIIDNVLRKYGHRIGIHSHDIGGWYAIVALRETVRKVGIGGLAEILQVLNGLGWTSGRAAKSRLLLSGLTQAVKRGLTVDQIIALCRQNYPTPEDYIAEVTRRARGRKPTIAAAAMIDEVITQRQLVPQD